MADINFEIFLGNISFVTLFLIMILYWVQALFSILPKFNFLIFLTTLCANVSLFSLLTIRWVHYGHFPLSNLYESLLFLSWSFTLIQMIFIISLSHSNSRFTNLNKINYNTIIGVILSPIALFTSSFATFSLPKTMQKAQALVPALQSNWLMMHVTVMMLSYTALLCGSLLAITFLIITWHSFQKLDLVQKQRNLKNQKIMPEVSPSFFSKSKNLEKVSPKLGLLNESKNLEINQVSNQNGIQNNLALKKIDSPEVNLETAYPKFSVALIHQTSKRGISDVTTSSSSFKFPSLLNLKSLINQTSSKLLGNNSLVPNQELELSTLAKTLDNLSYRIIGIGFPLLTIGILSGAVWANEAWGSYWSWDPKETWAFITWLIFAIYLHTRITKGWEGKKPAIIASCGFFIVWICYLGVNILGTGLHSYGWIQFGT